MHMYYELVVQPSCQNREKEQWRAVYLHHHYISDQTTVSPCLTEQIRTEPSRPVTPDSVNKRLSEHYIRRRSSGRWDGPTHSFTTWEARLPTLNNYWPHKSCPNLTLAALAEAGFSIPVSGITKVGGDLLYFIFRHFSIYINIHSLYRPWKPSYMLSLWGWTKILASWR
jgi:hypothetical protein